MFSTTLSVADAYPRVVTEFFSIEKKLLKINKNKVYIIAMLCIGLVSIGIIHYGSNKFTLLVDFVASLSFLASPVLAWFNFQLFTQKEIPDEFKLSTTFRLFSLACLASLVIFNIVYFWFKFYV
ncbi:hypothetical protein [Psychroflexus salis]|uniref:Uncharacterized protein n=1 Tax=Psychroflexus salis TaxID=1526574 RepID=A0A916ZS82_9FLAO|nr:hypothetical protein [Psychroflexus salis]GGE10391.1 hypothetical protein GCM10010831_09860 [Psychroflexus salis]